MNNGTSGVAREKGCPVFTPHLHWRAIAMQGFPLVKKFIFN
jgi:hypothetical protein